MPIAMQTAMTTTGSTGARSVTDEITNPLVYRLAGLAFATVLPAAFWIAVAASLADFANISIAASAYVAAGAAIAAFLGSVCAPIMLKS